MNIPLDICLAVIGKDRMRSLLLIVNPWEESAKQLFLNGIKDD